MSSIIMPFLGGLRNQAPEIVSALHYYAEDARMLCDPFFGGGSISFEAKRRGLTVWSNDLALRSKYPAEAFIVNETTIPPSAVNRLLEDNTGSVDYSGEVRLLDLIDIKYIRVARTIWYNAVNDCERYLAMRVFMSLVPMGAFGLIKKTDTSDLAREAFAKSDKKLSNIHVEVDKFRKIINNGISPTGLDHRAFARDGVEHIKDSVVNGCDIVHIDPPTYGTGQYDNYYWWLDWFVGDKVEVSGRGFSKKDCVDFSKRCVEAGDGARVVAITQQEVSYPKDIAFGLLEGAGRECFGYEIQSNTKNPFYLVIGVK